MENYIWVVIAAATSFAIFLIWILRDRRPGGSPRRGVEGSAGLLAAEAATDLPVVRAD